MPAASGEVLDIGDAVTVVRSAVFLDRDGVLVDTPAVADGTPQPQHDLDAITVSPGVPEACARLKAAGLVLVMVTNQPDIARGAVTRGVVDEANRRIREVCDLDAVMVCPHDDGDQCPCRKPKPGMLVAAAAALDVDLASSVMVGDRWRDVQAGVAAGVATVFVDHGYLETPANLAADVVVPSLSAAVPFILGRRELLSTEGVS